MPPLTPGTNKKLTEVLNASFASWEKEVQSYKITKGKCRGNLIDKLLMSSKEYSKDYNLIAPALIPADC